MLEHKITTLTWSELVRSVGVLEHKITTLTWSELVRSVGT